MNGSLYRLQLLERSKNLRHLGRVDQARTIQATNPLCGDDQEIDLKFVEGKLVEASFRPRGCLISKVATDFCWI